MKNEKGKHRLASWVTIFLLIVLVIYPLSVGPLAMAKKLTGDSPEFNRAIDPYYVPLRKLPSPLRGLLARWALLWRNEEPQQ